MATIDLNNLIRPKKVNSSTTVITEKVKTDTPVYTDLHLDLEIFQSIGLGDNPVNSRDIMVDYDYKAIHNSIKNIFNTKKGQKLLNPEFGCSLEQYLFEAVSDARAKAIGDDIYAAINVFEPRVDIVKIYVQSQPYSTQSINFVNGSQLVSTLQNKVKTNPNDMPEVGPGYAISVIYQIKEIKKQNTLNIFAQIGGQILI